MSTHECLNPTILLYKVYNVSIYRKVDLLDVDHLFVEITFNIGLKLSFYNYLFSDN